MGKGRKKERKEGIKDIPFDVYDKNGNFWYYVEVIFHRKAKEYSL